MGWVVRQNNNYPAYTILNFANMIYIAGHLVTDNNDNPPRRIRGLWTAQVNAIEQSTTSVEQRIKSVEQSIKSVRQSIKKVIGTMKKMCLDAGQGLISWISISEDYLRLSEDGIQWLPMVCHLVQ